MWDKSLAQCRQDADEIRSFLRKLRFYVKINMKHFPDAVFNFYKQNDELATLTKLFSSKRRVVCTPYLPDSRKVEIFTLFAGEGVQDPIFVKMAGSRRRLEEIAPNLFHKLCSIYALCDKNFIDFRPQEV